MKTIGNRIKKLREERELTQEELAKFVNSTKQTIYKYENDIITNIPSDKIEKIAEALNTDPSYLMGWTSHIKFDSGYDAYFTSDENEFLYIFNKIHKSTPETAEEHIKLFKKNYNNFISLIGDINIESLNLFMDYIEKTFPEYKFQLNIEEIKSLYEDVKKYTEFSLKKIANKKEVQEYLLPVAAHNDNLGEEQQEKMKRDMIKIKNNKNNKNI